VQPSSNGESIAGSIVPLVEDGAALQVGSVPSSTTIQLELVFSIKNAQQFQACLASIETPQSPNYRHFLNAKTLAPYLPTPGEKSSVVSFLTHAGLRVSDGASPLVLLLKGTVGTVENTFGVKLGLFEQNSSRFFASTSNPKLPQNFAQITAGIIGLDNYTIARPAETPCGLLGLWPDCPQAVQVGYSMDGLYSSGYNGAGVTVAVADVPGDPDPQGAIDTFDSQYGLQSVTLNVLYPDGFPGWYDPGWASETAMDIEAVHSMAPGAGITLLYDFDLMNAIDYVATNHIASIVSNSWAYGPESQLPQSFMSSVDTRLMADAAQGLAILFASGDSGSNPGGSLGTEFPASDPNVLSVGATDSWFAGCGWTTCSGYGSEDGASISGGGYSGQFAEPSWQTSTVGTEPGRGVPDVSILGNAPEFWVYSTYSDECGTAILGPTAGWFGCTGTSLSTPLWAGFLAVAFQIAGGGSFGNIDPQIYALGSSTSYSSLFHDIVSGSNGPWPWSPYSAGPGWDPVTGWGSPIGDQLAYSLAAAMTIWFITVPTSAYDGTFYSNLCPGALSGCSLPSSASTSWGDRIYAVAGFSGTLAITIYDCCYEGDYYSLWQTTDLSGLSGWTKLGTTQQVLTGPELNASSFNPYWTGTGTQYSSTTFSVLVSTTTLFAVRDELFDNMVTLLGPDCFGSLVVTSGCNVAGIHASPGWSPAGYTISFVSAGTSGILAGGGTSWPSSEGVTVTVTGSSSPDGTYATLTVEDLFDSQPVGTSNPGLGGPIFYDVQITGITDGMAQACISDSAIVPETVMKYYASQLWVGISTQFTAPDVACGEIPVAALTGTFLALGTPPAIFLSPSVGTVGTSVTISGSGLSASHILTVTYDGSTTGMPTCSADSSGNIGAGCIFTVPSSVSGPHLVVVTDGTNNASATFTVFSWPSVNPSWGNVGATITLSGTGFLASHVITASFSGTPLALGGTCTTTSTGSLGGCTFIVPHSVLGIHEIVVSDGTNIWSTDFTVTRKSLVHTCDYVITSSTKLSQDIGPCSGAGLVIGANGIVLNCAGHTISGIGVGIGIDFSGSNGDTVKNCRVTGFTVGFALDGSSSDILTGNTANNNVFGFIIHGSSSSVFGRNIAKNNIGDGFHFEFASNSNKITGNTASNNGNEGFAFYLSSGNSLARNTANSNAVGFIMWNVSDTTLVRNTASKNRVYGFGLYMSSNNDSLTKNTASKNGYDGFEVVESSSSTFAGNTANGNSHYGFHLYGSSNNTLIMNTAINDPGNGFYIEFSADNTLIRNTASNNRQDGFYLSGSSSNTLTGNTARSNGWYGFALYSSSSNTLTANTAKSNGQYGYSDDSIGGGTRGTANTYTSNICRYNGLGGSSPTGLGSPQP
jgi:parallel beta-helix repeat protein